LYLLYYLKEHEQACKKELESLAETIASLVDLKETANEIEGLKQFEDEMNEDFQEMNKSLSAFDDSAHYYKQQEQQVTSTFKESINQLRHSHYNRALTKLQSSVIESKHSSSVILDEIKEILGDRHGKMGSLFRS
jgi:uncharacterized phage infection (PIP) family protein YhgE